MELEYDSRGRISTQKLLVGRTSSMERITYSADGHVLEVVGTSDWKFVYDENGNVVSIMEQGQKLTLGYDSGDRVVQVSDFFFLSKVNFTLFCLYLGKLFAIFKF